MLYSNQIFLNYIHRNSGTYDICLKYIWCFFFLIIIQLDTLISQIYSWNETLHVSDSSSVNHQEFFTVHSNGVCYRGLQTACEQDQDGTPDDGQRNCPKHVEFHSKNKFEKLVHLVGFIIRKLTRCMVTWTSNSYLMLCRQHDATYLHYQ